LKDHWRELHRSWAKLKPPYRPNAEVVEAVRGALGVMPESVLLLGVTPELAEIGRRTIAVDINPTMVAAIWPGNTKARNVVRADWRQLPIATGAVTVVLGDAAINNVPFPAGYHAVFAELRRVLAPGGRVVTRVQCGLDEPERPDIVRGDALAGRILSFHTLKFRVALATAAEDSDRNVPVARILDAFMNWFPDRDDLAHATGWSLDDIATIDAYRDSTLAYSYPTPESLRDCAAVHFDDVALATSGSYEGADHCPLLVLGNG